MVTTVVTWTSPIYQSKVLGEFPDISDDSLILPRWIEAVQKRTLERTRRPIIAADIARFGGPVGAGSGRVKACTKQHMELSEPCTEAMFQLWLHH